MPKHRQKLNRKDLGPEIRPRSLRISDARKRLRPKPQKEDERGDRSLGRNPSLSPEAMQCQLLEFKMTGVISPRLGPLLT